MGFKSCIWDIQYQLLKKTALDFLETWSSSFWIVYVLFEGFGTNLWKYRPMSPKPIKIPLKMTLKEAQSLRFELCFVCFSSCEWQSCCEKFEINVRELIPIFVRLQCWVLPALVFGGYVWYFGSLHPAFEMSCEIEYFGNQLLFPKQHRNFPKRRWVRSKKVFLSSAGLVSLVVLKKPILRTSSDLFIWNNTCFSFKCRVTFGLRQTSKATFGTLAHYILRLRCLAKSNT